MHPKIPHPVVAMPPGKKTALLFAVLALFAGLQAKDNDRLPPAVTANVGKSPIRQDTAAAVAPTLVVQPVSQTVPAGFPVDFTTSASGIPAPTYQWQKGGVAIRGATGSSYQIASMGADDAGRYTVVIANAAGVVTSEVAELKLFVAPPSHGVVSISVE